MLKGLGQFFAAIIGAVLPLLLLGAIGYFELPKLYARWREGEAAIAIVPELRATIAQDGQDLAAQKQLCLSSAARAQKNAALINRLSTAAPAPGHAPGLTASDITELLQ